MLHVNPGAEEEYRRRQHFCPGRKPVTCGSLILTRITRSTMRIWMVDACGFAFFGYSVVPLFMAHFRESTVHVSCRAWTRFRSAAMDSLTMRLSAEQLSGICVDDFRIRWSNFGCLTQLRTLIDQLKRLLRSLGFTSYCLGDPKIRDTGNIPLDCILCARLGSMDRFWQRSNLVHGPSDSAGL